MSARVWHLLRVSTRGGRHEQDVFVPSAGEPPSLAVRRVEREYPGKAVQYVQALQNIRVMD